MSARLASLMTRVPSLWKSAPRSNIPTMRIVFPDSSETSPAWSGPNRSVRDIASAIARPGRPQSSRRSINSGRSSALARGGYATTRIGLGSPLAGSRQNDRRVSIVIGTPETTSGKALACSIRRLGNP